MVQAAAETCQGVARVGSERTRQMLPTYTPQANIAAPPARAPSARKACRSSRRGLAQTLLGSGTIPSYRSPTPSPHSQVSPHTFEHTHQKKQAPQRSCSTGPHCRCQAAPSWLLPSGHQLTSAHSPNTTPRSARTPTRLAVNAALEAVGEAGAAQVAVLVAVAAVKASRLQPSGAPFTYYGTGDRKTNVWGHMG